jgi:protein-S-isoprenylcysteine O-methyltransferase Ste14
MPPISWPLAFHGVYGVIFVASDLLWCGLEGMAVRTKRIRVGATNFDGGSKRQLILTYWLGLIVGVVCALSLPAATIGWHQPVVFAIGIVCILAGVALRWYAIATLGVYFTRDLAVRPNQQVIQYGPYRHVRHPSYTGTLLTTLGIALALTNWASLVVMLLCAGVAHYRRAQVEEQLLVERLGKPYVEYMRQTRRFIPFVW